MLDTSMLIPNPNLRCNHNERRYVVSTKTINPKASKIHKNGVSKLLYFNISNTPHVINISTRPK